MIATISRNQNISINNKYRLENWSDRPQIFASRSVLIRLAMNEKERAEPGRIIWLPDKVGRRGRLFLTKSKFYPVQADQVLWLVSHLDHDSDYKYECVYMIVYMNVYFLAVLYVQ